MACARLRDREHRGALRQACAVRGRGHGRFIRLRHPGRVRPGGRDHGVRRLCGGAPRRPVVEGPARPRPGVPGRRCAGHRRPRVLAWTAANARRFVLRSRRMRLARRVPAPRAEHSEEDFRRIAARGVHGSGGTRHIRSRNWHARRPAARRRHVLPHVELPVRDPGLRDRPRRPPLQLAIEGRARDRQL